MAMELRLWLSPMKTRFRSPLTLLTFFLHSTLVLFFSEGAYSAYPSKSAACVNKGDGYRPNPEADPPLSSYVKCVNERVFQVRRCKVDTLFWEKLQACVPIHVYPHNRYSYSESDSDSEADSSTELEANSPFPAVSESNSQFRLDSVIEISKAYRLKGHSASREAITAGSSSGFNNETDAQALIDFKNGFSNPNTLFKTWDPSTNVCTWKYVQCNKNGRVNALQVNARSNDGIISPSITNLTQLEKLSITGLLPSSSIFIPPEIGNLTELKSLDLSNNFLTGEIPSSLSNCVKLTSLHLETNKLFGGVPPELGNLVSMKSFVVSNNFLSGSIFSTLLKFTEATEIRIDQNSFSEPLPSDFSPLTKLIALDVSLNKFYGPISPSISLCKSLTELVVNGNEFTGVIPSELGNLTKLTTLDLSENYLEGEIPPSLGKLKDLSVLYLSANNLTGNIPEEIGELQSLAFFFLAFNRFSGIIQPKVISMSFLTYLDMNNNLFEGEFPSVLLDLFFLEYLDLGQNRFSGSLPTNITNLVQTLVYLRLENNSFTGGIPPIYGDFQVLDQLLLMNNNLTGEIPKELGNIQSLTGLQLTNNSFVGSIPSSLGNILGLEYLLLEGNQLEGSLPENLFKPTNLGVIRLNNNNLTGKIPASLLELNFATEILLQFNKLEGSLTLSDRDLDALTTLNVKGNRLTGPITVPRNCTGLFVLDLSYNLFSGNIPKDIGKCSNLQKLYLSGNPLSGNLPPSVGNFTPNLDTLSVRNASLSGDLSPNISDCLLLKFLDLSENQLSGSIPSSWIQLKTLTQIKLNDNLLNGPIPSVLGNLSFLQSIELQNNNLTGEIPSQLSQLSYLTTLNLSHNQLIGSIPYSFRFFGGLSSFDVSFNKLSGSIPGGNLSNFPVLSYSNNTALCGFPLAACPKNGKGKLGLILGSAIGGAVFAALVLSLAVFARQKYLDATAGKMLVFKKLGFPLTIQSIRKATNNFSEDFRLGKGGFGTVYKAQLQDGRIVAIKRLADASTQGEREFEAEMQTLGAIHHKNLVTLIASYLSTRDNECLLIYDFLPGGSLDGYFNKEMTKDNPFHYWSKRLHVAQGTARGMKYLHHDCNPPIIHRDMKPGNILLDEEHNAHVADFGLARKMEAGATHMSTEVFGTIGYLAPEYTQKGRLTEKSDVFAFGVVLLQLVSGKQPTNEEVGEQGGLARWAKSSMVDKVVDPQMKLDGEKGSMDQVLAALKVGLLCTNRDPGDRPTMAEVLHLLENLDEFANGIDETKLKE